MSEKRKAVWLTVRATWKRYGMRKDAKKSKPETRLSAPCNFSHYTAPYRRKNESADLSQA
jgi:hypothetical protein